MEDAPKKQIPCLDGMFTMPPEEPYLLAMKCGSCGYFYFPKVSICRNPDCNRKEPLEDVRLSTKGKLHTFTVNYFMPPPPYHPPDPFVPYANGIIVLPEGLKVRTMIGPGYDEKSLTVGMDMELIRDKLYEDQDGNEVLTWLFQPAQT